MTTQSVLDEHGLATVKRFRVTYPDVIRYIRFEGNDVSLRNNRLFTPSELPPEALSILITSGMVEVYEQTTLYWYVFRTPGSTKPVIHPNPISEDSADQLITLGAYEILSKTPA